MEEFNKVAPNLLKEFGFSDDEISNCITNVAEENKIRDKIISKLKSKYSLTKYKDNFPVVWYVIKDGEQNIFIDHDCSRWLHVYKDERYNAVTFDPLEDDCLEKMIEHIDNLIKSIKI